MRLARRDVRFRLGAAPIHSLLEQPGPKKFKLFRIGIIHKAKQFKVLPLAN